MRTKVYKAIVELLSDGERHSTEELWTVTTHPAEWLTELSRNPSFEYDSSVQKVRLLSPPAKMT